MDLQYYLTILWRRKWVIIVTALLTEIVVIIGTLLTMPIYSTTTTLRIALASSGSVTSTDYYYADRLMNTYVKLATTTPVLDELIQRLGLSKLPPIEVKAVPQTELLQITAEHNNPDIAALAANTLADILISQSLELYTGSGESSLEILAEQVSSMEQEVTRARAEYLNLVANTPEDIEGIQNASQMLDLKQQMYASILEQYEETRQRLSLRANSISVVEPALPPDDPSKPRKLSNIALGLLVGLVGGLGLTFLLENLDTSLYTTDQIESVSELKVIGKIPTIKQKGLLRLRKSLNKVNGAAFNESFQKLQTKIFQQNVNGQPIKSLLITSAVPGEGKSTIVSNLAIAMAKVGQHVIVVDCDLRLPTQHKIFNLPNKLGLSSFLNHEAMLIDVLQKSHNQNAWVITSGPLVSNPIELIRSPQMKSLIDLLVQKYEYVLLDTPAMLPVGDATALLPMADMMILVARKGYCKESTLREACKTLADMNHKIIGVVVNESQQNGSHYYYKKNYYT